MRRVKLMTAAAVVAVMTMVGGAAAQDTNTQERTFLTFSSAFELPGLTLQPGTYVFKLADTGTRNVVQVWNRDEKDMRGHWTFIRSPQFAPLFRLIYAEIHHFPDLARFYAEEVVARGQRLIAGIVERGIASGEFRSVEPLAAARMLTAPFVMHGLWCTHREAFTSVARKTDEQILDELIDFYLHAIRSTASAPVESRAT